MADLKEELSETMYCILLSLREERHGYGVIQHVADFTAGHVQVGAGTVYTSLKKLERAGWIDHSSRRARDRRLAWVTGVVGALILVGAAVRVAFGVAGAGASSEDWPLEAGLLALIGIPLVAVTAMLLRGPGTHESAPR